jgi:hypothetical protein
VGGGEEERKWESRVIECKYCVYVYVNGNMISTETIPGRGGEGR